MVRKAAEEGGHESRSSELVVIPFGEDQIQCISGDASDDYRVILKTTCENMGVDYSAQLKKLKAEHWAVVAFTAMTAKDGKTYQVATIDRPTFKMWMLKFTASRIKNSEVRAKIERYQVDALDVIDRYFDDQLNARSHANAGFPAAAIETLLHAMTTILNRQDATIQGIKLDMARFAERQEMRAIRPMREVPPGWHRLVPWARGLGIDIPRVDHAAQGKICTEISIRKGIEPIWAQPPGEKRPANYYPKFILERWLKRFLTANPIWRELLLFQPD